MSNEPSDRGPTHGITGLAYPGSAILDLGAARIGLGVGGFRAEFLSWGFFEPRPWRNYLHTHSFFEICYAYAGCGVFRNSGTEYVVQRGMLFVARPGDLHEIVSSEQDPLGIHFWAYTLVPNPASRRIGSDESDSDESSRALLEAFVEPHGAAVSNAVGRTPVLLEQLSREAAAPGPAFDEVVTALSTALVVDTARAVTDLPPPTALAAAGQAPSRDELVVRAMVRYLQDNYDRPVPVRDVVAQVHLSERHGGRLFRRVMGITIHAYLARFRLEVAAQMLLEQGASVTSIARACGYPDVRHFVTAFRRHWGRSPTDFRARKGTTHLE